MGADPQKIQLVVRPYRVYSGELALYVAGNEDIEIREALKNAGFEAGDIVEVKLICRGDKIVVDPKTYVKPGQTWRVKKDGHYMGDILIGDRHHSDRGWHCKNLGSGTGFFWINDGHWTYDQPSYRMVLVDEVSGSRP